jgi:hypothetical protein
MIASPFLKVAKNGGRKKGLSETTPHRPEIIHRDGFAGAERTQIASFKLGRPGQLGDAFRENLTAACFSERNRAVLTKQDHLQTEI